MTGDIEIYSHLLLALAIGLLIGVERGWQARGKPEGSRQAGMRTFTLYGLLGGLTGMLGSVASDAVVVVIGIGVGALIVAGYIVGLRNSEDAGTTTEVAAFITFVLGALAAKGEVLIAAVAAVIVAAVLDLKTYLHDWLKRVEAAELGTALKLLVISVVLLPVLPDENFGPGGALNPYELWLVVVLIGLVSFAGYAAMKILGGRAGPLLMGVLGGIASSTALAVGASRMARDHAALTAGMSGSIAAATSIMAIRILVITFLLAPGVAAVVFAPLLAASVAAAAWAVFETTQARHGGPLTLGEPADLGLAIKFALLLAAFAVLVYYAKRALGEEALIGVAALSGLVDVDATTVTMSRGVGMTPPLTTVSIAGGAILVAAAVNQFAKCCIAIWIAGPDLGKRVAIMSVIAGAVAGGIAFLGTMIAL